MHENKTLQPPPCAADRRGVRHHERAGTAAPSARAGAAAHAGADSSDRSIQCGRCPMRAATLRIYPGKPGRAAGQVITVMGRVLDLNGQPIPQARIEVWQANCQGPLHTHPNDDNPAPLDANFDGFAVMTTDTEGRYPIQDHQAGGLSGRPGLIRPPHIHFTVSGQREPPGDADVFRRRTAEPARPGFC